LQAAGLILTAALDAGFRESGAMDLQCARIPDAPIMVGIRSMGVSFDCIIGYQEEDGTLHSIVDDKYVRNMLVIANSRFQTNGERTHRFQTNVNRLFRTEPEKEDEETRRQRKRAEGLARQQLLNGHKSETADSAEDQTALLDLWT
jgi:tRNA wybutosine-synthesizing protein 3